MPEPKRLDYESALNAFLGRKWKDTKDLLKYLTNDGPSEFLLEHMSASPSVAL